jgi:vacuolar protein-sorting-associated protein 4
MSIQSFVQSAAKDVNNGKDAESSGRYREAIVSFTRAIQHYKAAISNEKSLKAKTILSTQVSTIIDKIKELEKMDDSPVAAKEKKQPIEGENNNNDETSRMNGVITSLKLSPEELPDITWDDIIGLENVKDLLRDTVQLPLEMPQIFYGNRQPPTSLLLYGPPGTGKTHIMKALAKQSNLTFFPITTASIISKYVGDSAKYIKAMFETIKASKPCILFIDEIDALCTDRETGQQSGESTKAINEFLIQLDGITKDDMSGVLLVGATNLPWRIDGGVLRRFNRRIYIPLPSIDDRHRLLQYCISFNENDVGPVIDNEALWKVAERTVNFSGSDINNLIKAAYAHTIRLIVTATHFKASGTTKENFYIIPCSATDEGARPLIYQNIKDKSKIKSPAITLEHIILSLDKIKSAVNPDTLNRYETWTELYGEV